MSSKLVFPMFTPIFPHSENICLEPYLMSHGRAQETIRALKEDQGEGFVCTVLPFANRIRVDSINLDVTNFEANFLSLGTDYEEFESGPAPFSVVIYLKDDGQMGSAAVHRVKFINTTEATAL